MWAAKLLLNLLKEISTFCCVGELWRFLIKHLVATYLSIPNSGTYPDDIVKIGPLSFSIPFAKKLISLPCSCDARPQRRRLKVAYGVNNRG